VYSFQKHPRSYTWVTGSLYEQDAEMRISIALVLTFAALSLSSDRIVIGTADFAVADLFCGS